MTDKNIDRREALIRVGAAAAVPVAARLTSTARAVGLHPLVPKRGQEPWAPIVFDPHQNDTVVALAELIIPETDTPGATAALVNQFIDFELSEDSEDQRDAFFRGLEWLDRSSQERYGRVFIELEVEQQNELISGVANPDFPDDEIGRSFFDDMKRRTVAGYYTSRLGMQIELGFRGNTYLQRFEGCTHAEHLQWEPGPDSENQ